MILTELLDAPAEFTVTEDSDAAFYAEFKTGGREIRFFASNEEADYGDDQGEWIIEFGEVEDGGKLNYNKTGSGNEMTVFATLKAILNEFIRKRKPKTIKFSADKDKKNNRARVYAKLFQRNLPSGWKLEQDNDAHDINVFFQLVKEEVIDDWLSLESIKKIWHDANEKVFDGQLAMPKMTLEDDLNYLARRYGPDAQEEAKHGDMLGYCDKEGSRIILRFSKKIKDVKELLEVVVHEMVHQAEAERIGWLTMLKDPHGEEFLAWETRVSKYHNLSLRQIIGH